jgi:hypothetical protein
LRNRLATFLIQEVTKFFTTEAADSTADVLRKAAVRAIDEKGVFDVAKFPSYVADELEQKLSGLLKDKLKSWGSRVAEDLVEQFAP